MSYSVAIVGATGNVGMEMLNILAEREFLYQRFTPLPHAGLSAVKSRSATRSSSAKTSSSLTSPRLISC
jgi:aspartate-semialdehyde dehydrogenase